MIEEVKITLEEERQQRVDELSAMRRKDKLYGLKRIEIGNIIEQLNQ